MRYDITVLGNGKTFAIMHTTTNREEAIAKATELFATGLYLYVEAKEIDTTKNYYYAQSVKIFTK